MTVSKTAARSIDFDDIERQLREVARINEDRSRGGAPTPSLELAVQLRSEGSPATAPKTGADESRVPLYEVEQVPDISQARGSSTRVGLTFALPVVLVAAGVSAVMMMRAGPMGADGSDIPVLADHEPARTLPAIVNGNDQTPSARETAVSPGKLDETVLAMRGQLDVTVATPDSKQVAAQPSAAPSLRLAEEAPAHMPTIAAKVPLPDAPEGPPQSSMLGTPSRVSTILVKPDEVHTPIEKQGPHASASAASTTKIASTEARVSVNAPIATVAAARRHADTARAKSPNATSAKRRQSNKPAMSILPPVSAVTTQPREASQPQSNPVSTVANGFRKVLEMARIVGSTAEPDGQ